MQIHPNDTAHGALHPLNPAAQEGKAFMPSTLAVISIQTAEADLARVCWAVIAISSFAMPDSGHAALKTSSASSKRPPPRTASGPQASSLPPVHCRGFHATLQQSVKDTQVMVSDLSKLIKQEFERLNEKVDYLITVDIVNREEVLRSAVNAVGIAYDDLLKGDLTDCIKLAHVIVHAFPKPTSTKL